MMEQRASEDRRVAFGRTWLVAAVGCLAAARMAAALPGECGRIVTFEEGKQPLRVILVAPAGDDVAGDGTRAAPYRTLGRAVKEARPGTAIRLRAGEYQGGVSIADLAGSAAAPIWIGGVPGERRPVFTGGSSGLHFTRVRYLVVHDLEVVRARVNGINCDDGGAYDDPEATSHVVFRDLKIGNIGDRGNQDGLKLSGVDFFWVLRCELTRCGAGGSGIDHVGCHQGVVAGSLFHDLGSNAIQCKGGSEEIEIRGNRFVNAGQRAVNIGGSTGFRYFRPPLDRSKVHAEARRIRVVSNVFEGSDAPVAFVGAVECLVANNTILDPGRYVIRVLQETRSRDGMEFLPCGRSRFVNNLVWFRSEGLRSHLNVGEGTLPETFRFEHNLWYAWDRPERSRPVLPVAEEGAVVGRDPAFLDRAGRNFRLGKGSPAVGQGKGVAEVTGDFDGACWETPPSMGAFEARAVE